MTDERKVSTYFTVLLVKIAIARVDGVVAWCAAENQLKVGAGRGERDLGMALSTAILKSYLPFFHGPVSVTGVSHLQTEKRIFITVDERRCIRIHGFVKSRKWDISLQDILSSILNNICESQYCVCSIAV